MSIHVNPDGSNTDGVKVEPNGGFISHQIALAITASTQLTVPGKGETQAVIQADGNDVRYRLDGTSPTATVGVILKNGTSIVLNMTDATAAKFIQTAATAVLNVTYTM